jgi:hypothetical protein
MSTSRGGKEQRRISGVRTDNPVPVWRIGVPTVNAKLTEGFNKKKETSRK